ncbi:glycerate kinase [Microlunatus sagamiharensis]|uniref:Glycerate kinase n=1 Tax=Microlunatus sagamiharensis TaxID=546874 RepID=A0A1H2MS50_9ACTN|nr:glycerate kinase [Microlunatus sagamiharensis]SDU95944.1 glycerate kinase [Microlunatus sagamiharensis]
MRVLVCSDAVGGLSSAEAGRCLAEGWPGQRTAVVPVGEAGAGFVGAVADRWGVAEEPVVVNGRVGVRARGPLGTALGLPGDGPGEGPVPYAASSLPLGRLVADSLPATGALLVDLVGDDVHDGGAGLLAALGAEADVDLTAGTAGLRGLTRLDLEAARGRLAGTDLVGVVPAAQRSTPLLGLRGITSVRGRAVGDDAEPLLAADAGLQRLAELSGDGLGSVPGAGACGGTALAVLALGGRLVGGPELALGGITGPVDLVVTGCSVFDFAHRGGGVIAAAAALASRLLAPCVVVAGEVVIGAREMRTMGVEAAYPVHGSDDDAPGGAVGADELAETARRVGRTWRW